MTKLFTFLCITLMVVLIEHSYFEYVISREFSEWGAALSVGAIMIAVGYAYYVYKLLIDVLKINK